jgi:hypothetical protein
MPFLFNTHCGLQIAMMDLLVGAGAKGSARIARGRRKISGIKSKY